MKYFETILLSSFVLFPRVWNSVQNDHLFAQSRLAKFPFTELKKSERDLRSRFSGTNEKSKFGSNFWISGLGNFQSWYEQFQIFIKTLQLTDEIEIHTTNAAQGGNRSPMFIGTRTTGSYPAYKFFKTHPQAFYEVITHFLFLRLNSRDYPPLLENRFKSSLAKNGQLVSWLLTLCTEDVR